MSLPHDSPRSDLATSAAEARFRALLEAAPDPIVIVDDRGRILLVNSQTERVFGYDRGEILNERIEVLVPGRFRAAHGAHRHAFTQKPQVRPMGAGMQLSGLRKDGTEFPVEISLSPYESSEGRLIFATVRDVSERRRMEEALLRHQTRLIDQAFDAICTWGPGRIISSWNAGAERLYGYAVEEARGRSIHDLLHTRGLPDDLAERLARDKNWSGELVQTTSDGRTVVVDSRMTLITGAHATQETLEVNRDITARREAEQERSAALHNLEAANRDLAHLSRELLDAQERERAVVARELHDEIGQLLTALRLGLGLARRQPADLPARLADAEAVVSDLVARVRELTLRLRPAALDDLGLVGALMWLFERYTIQTGIQVDFQQSGLSRRLPAHLETTAYRIVQESLTNVARHAGVPQVQVRLNQDEKQLAVAVKDSGRGFDAGAVGSMSSGLRGMRERSKLLGGTLLIESAPGRGTTVQAALPLEEAPLSL